MAGQELDAERINYKISFLFCERKAARYQHINIADKSFQIIADFQYSYFGTTQNIQNCFVKNLRAD